jgi:hypothetical protein
VLRAAWSGSEKKSEAPLRGPRSGTSRSAKLAENRSALDPARAIKRASTNSQGGGRLSLTLVENRSKSTAHAGMLVEAGERRACNLAPTGKYSSQILKADWTVFANDGDCVAPGPLISTNICECGAVAYRRDTRVTAQLPLTRVRRLQPGVSRLQRKPGRFVSVQRPRLSHFAPDKS